MADEVATTFPGENAAGYYSPFKKTDRAVIPASGRFIDHLEYVNRALRRDGALLPIENDLMEVDLVELENEEEG